MGERRACFAGGLAGAALPAGYKGAGPLWRGVGRSADKDKVCETSQDMEMQRHKFVEKVETYMYCYAMDEAESGVRRHP